MKKPSSLIKWTGSKRTLSLAIYDYFPQANRYFEPFIGGGAMLFLASSKYEHCYASDIYQPLIDFWKKIKSLPEEVINNYKVDWEKLQEDFPTYYYEVRSRFNQSPNAQDLVFLSRTCVNGIIRFNSSGEFNNSLHVSRRGMTPNNYKKIVDEWSPKLRNTTFDCKDYTAILSDVKEGDFVYLDPPYANSKNRYIQHLDIEKLYDFLRKLNAKNVMWAMSFDGIRGESDLIEDIPRDLYKRFYLINAGNSSVKNVLSSTKETVHEALYLNY